MNPHVPVGRTVACAGGIGTDRVSEDMLFLFSTLRPRESVWITQQEFTDFVTAVKRGDFDNA